MKTCECGCGQETKLASKTLTSRGWKKGEPLRFINGHNDPYKNKKNSKLKRSCIECGKDVYFWPSSGDVKFCGLSCSAIYHNRKNISPFGHMKMSSGGYWQIKVKDHPYSDKHSYIMYHRYVLEQHLGEYISPEYDVHHKDENKQNNSLDNLEKLTKSEHMKLHALKRSKREKGYLNARRSNR